MSPIPRPFETHDTSGGGAHDSRRKSLFTNEFASSYWQVYAYVLTLVPQGNDADDVMQDVAVVLWEKFDEFEPGTSFGNWARAIAFRVARAFARKKTKSLGYGLDEDVLRQLAQVQSGTSELLELRQAYLNECLDRLSADDRNFVFACESKHGSVAELARQQKKPQRKLYHRLDRIRQRLAACVQHFLAKGDME
ncbi:sigma-70 family RNA polymerase sigma factor [Calycomorphotria hydatis]|uniref:RNA polymerase sigma factor n=1 Tax=Calycomorphotria hydatis TaxID=2528027 RepID=A0A517TFD2_9PLAN|nr:sigma-70 family RNA polymerase sigma factor [Calycomorphotria hydatis]QDT67086.1 RNA polymerase sigma factor [Calycomorphotria hydatis]